MVVAYPTALAPQDLSAAEKYQGRDRHDVVTADDFGQVAVVDIDLVNVYAAVHLLAELVDYRVHGLAGTAPGREKIYESQRIAPDDFVEVCHNRMES